MKLRKRANTVKVKKSAAANENSNSMFGLEAAE